MGFICGLPWYMFSLALLRSRCGVVQLQEVEEGCVQEKWRRPQWCPTQEGHLKRDTTVLAKITTKDIFSFQMPFQGFWNWSGWWEKWSHRRDMPSSACLLVITGAVVTNICTAGPGTRRDRDQPSRTKRLSGTLEKLCDNNSAPESVCCFRTLFQNGPVCGR